MIHGTSMSVLTKGDDVVPGDFNMYPCSSVLMESTDRKPKFFLTSVLIVLTS